MGGIGSTCLLKRHWDGGSEWVAMGGSGLVTGHARGVCYVNNMTGQDLKVEQQRL